MLKRQKKIIRPEGSDRGRTKPARPGTRPAAGSAEGPDAGSPTRPGARPRPAAGSAPRPTRGPRPEKRPPFRGEGRDDEQREGSTSRQREFDSSRDEDRTLLPGVKPVLEMLENNPERVDTVYLRKGRHGQDMDRIADLCREHGVRFSLLSPESFARIYSGGSQGVAARIFEAGFIDWETLAHGVMDAPMPLVLALDQVQDPGNAGTLARTLYALGGAGLLVPRHNGVFLGAAASRASAGALARLPVAKAGNLGQALDLADKLGFTIYGAVAESGSREERESLNVFTLTPRFPAVLVLGGEDSGLRPMIEKRCSHLVHIPMLREFDSLNVAQAGAVIVGVFSSYCKS